MEDEYRTEHVSVYSNLSLTPGTLFFVDCRAEPGTFSDVLLRKL